MAARETARDPVAPAAGSKHPGQLLEVHRGELIAHCRRMLGSGFEAEDAVQETFFRAWRASERFEGRSSLRTWLYRIATNVCLDMRDARQRRARPIDAIDELPGDPAGWIRPLWGREGPSAYVDPAEQAAARDTIRLAFVAALTHLPARQRSVLILRDVLRWKATEVAALFGTTVASVESALQRARSNLSTGCCPTDRSYRLDGDQLSLVQRYVDSLECRDIDSLVSLLR